MKNFQTFFAKVNNDGKVNFYDKTGIVMWLQLLRGKEVDITIAKDINRRTQRQNNALHLYFELLAEELNDAGISMKELMGQGVDIDWTPVSVKYIWKRIQKAMIGTDSTTDLKTDEVDKVYAVLDRFLTQEKKLHVPFPSINYDDPIWS